MMTFMTVVVLKMMAEKLKGTSLTVDSAFMNLHEQHAQVFDNQFITAEPQKKMNDVYKAFDIECPVTIERG